MTKPKKPTKRFAPDEAIPDGLDPKVGERLDRDLPPIPNEDHPTIIPKRRRGSQSKAI